MKSIGIIAEYNPFHNGHAYQLASIRQELATDVIVVVMSGNFLQRGEPAVYDKWTRATWALQSGADVVIELPVAHSVQAADYFAQGGIQILDALGVDAINFGVESGDATDFTEAARWFITHEELLKAKLKAEFSGQSYPERLFDIITELHPSFPLDLANPNNTLGLAYCKQIIKQSSHLTVTTLERKDAAYHQSELDPQKHIASATAIRHAVALGKSVEQFVPSAVSKLLEKQPMTDWTSFWPLLQYQIMVLTEQQLASIYEMPDGLPPKLKRLAIEQSSFETFIEELDQKHTTRVKMQRLCLYILLGLTNRAVVKAFEAPTPLHILGFSSVGRSFLNEQKHHLSHPLLTNINQQTASNWQLDIRAGNIYRLGARQPVAKQDFTRYPVIILGE